MDNNSKYKEYWEKMAQKQKEENKSFTHSDKYIPILERDEILLNLTENDRVLEIGCGACDNSIYYMPKVKEYLGIELIKTFVEMSSEKINKHFFKNSKIINYDGLKYVQDNKLDYDKLITQRFIINLATSDLQIEFFKAIYENTINRNAKLIICEGFGEELKNLNLLRRQIGLSNIPVAEYNNFLNLDILEKIQSIGFNIEKTKGFDTYIYSTRLFNNEKLMSNFDLMQELSYNLEKSNLSQISPSVSYVKIYVLSFKS